MKKHKFLLLISDNECMLQDLREDKSLDQALVDSIYYNEDPYLRVVEGVHESLRDNLVTIRFQTGPKVTDYDEMVCFKSTDGMLYYFTDSLSKIALINAFEQE